MRSHRPGASHDLVVDINRMLMKCLAEDHTSNQAEISDIGVGGQGARISSRASALRTSSFFVTSLWPRRGFGNAEMLKKHTEQNAICP